MVEFMRMKKIDIGDNLFDLLIIILFFVFLIIMIKL